MKKILLFAILMLSFVTLTSCTKGIDKYAEETLDETFKMCMEDKELGDVKYELLDKELEYKNDSICIMEFKAAMFADDGVLLMKKEFEYIVSRGYKSPHRIKEGRFERKVINQIKNGVNYMDRHNEELKYLKDDYEEERLKQGKSKDEFYSNLIFRGAHSKEGDFFIEKKID